MRVKDGDILTKGDAAKVLGLSMSMVEKFIAGGVLPVIRTPSGYRLLWAKDVRALAAKRAKAGRKGAKK